MRFNIVFSIPIHERYEVVLDQTVNFLTFNPGCAIVYHVSQGFNEKDSLLSRKEFEQIVSGLQGVFINPQSVRTGLSDIIQAHLCNYHYICQIIDFDYFSMCASNELFIKHGLYDVIKGSDCGVSFINIEERPEWVPAHFAIKDSCLTKMIHETGSHGIHPSNIEGSFYSKSIFSHICEVIERHYDYHKMAIKYPREEVYFSTILWSMIQEDTSIKVYPSLFTLVHWNIGRVRYDNMAISIRDIINAQNNNSPYFSVKRVDRRLTDCRRVFVRQRSGYYPSLHALLPDLKFIPYFKLYLNDAKDTIKQKWSYYVYVIKHQSNRIVIPSQNTIQEF